MHNPAPVLWDFDIQTDHLISARRPDLIIIIKKQNKKRTNKQTNKQKKNKTKKKKINKRTCKIVDFSVLVHHKIKLKESEKKDKYLELDSELKNCGIWRWQLYQL